jgi:hypothetical protein
MSKKSWLLLITIYFIGNFNLLIHANDFVFLQNSEYSDIAISHYPNLLYIQQSIQKDHQVPLWSNLIQSGYPLVENPLSGIWYICGWIALIFPLPLGININLLLHILMGTIGMCLLLRIEGRSEISSVFGAIAFGMSMKIVSHLGAGHLSMIYAIIWIPWLLYCTKKYLMEKMFMDLLLTGQIIGLIISADPRCIIPAGLLWVSYILLSASEWRRKIVLFLASTLIGLVTSLGCWYSLLQFLQYSTRSLLTAAERNIYALNFPDLLGLFFPNYGGFSEWVLYPSAIVLLFFVLGISLYKDNKKIRFWFFVFLVSLLLSFGDKIPGLRFLFGLPGFSLLRVPTRFLWAAFISYSFISSYVLDCLLTYTNGYKFDRLFFLVIVLIFIVLFGAGFWVVSRTAAPDLIYSCIFFIAGTAFIGLALHNKVGLNTKKIGFLLLLAIELSVVNISSLRFKDASSLLEQNMDVIQTIKALPDYARIYSPSYSLSQEELAYWQVNQINGIDPMQLTDYVRFFESASGIDYLEYSVTLPPFATGNLATDNSASCPDLHKLSQLNVGFIISDFEFQNCSGIQTAQLIGGKYVYRLDFALKPAYFENGETEVQLLDYSANHISVKTEQGGRLIFPEVFYPGWKAYIDGQETQIERKEIFRVVNVQEGEHIVELEFSPDYVPVVFWAQALSFFAIIIYAVMEWRNVRKTK